MTENFLQFGSRMAYKHIEKRGNRLAVFDNLVDWSRFEKLFLRQPKTGRPPYDPLVMFKVLVLQHLYNLPDEEIEYQLCNRLDFQYFLGFPKNVPDHTTIWRFREYLSTLNLHDKLWDELERQIEEKGIQFSKGVIQDATFITADPGKTNSSDKIDRGRGQPTTRNEDGTWTEKNGKSVFGYKLHVKTETRHGFITELAVTTASVHDSKIDLTNEDETVYRDKGYFGAKPRAKGDATMKRNVRGHKISIWEKLRNIRISKIRSVGERPFAVIKRTLDGGHTRYTEQHRVFTQQLMNCAVYNLLQLARFV